MRLAEISIDMINQKDCPRPDKWFLKSIKSDGVRIPVLLEKVDFGRYDIRDGRRRVFGAEHAALTTVPALVCEKEEFLENDRDYLTLLTKLHSSHNPVAELKAVQNLIQKGNLTLKEIAENLHVPLDRLKRIYKLANLTFWSDKLPISPRNKHPTSREFGPIGSLPRSHPCEAHR